MTTVERLRTTLEALNLTAVDARLESLLESASKKKPSYGDFLLEVMSAGSRRPKTALSENAAATGSPALREDLRSVRLPALDRRAADPRIADAAIRA